MPFQLGTSLTLSLLFCMATAVPIDSIQMGSKHTLYLATCTRRTSPIPDCPLIIICPAQAVVTYTAVAYFAGGPIESSRNSNPTQIATVSEPVQPWEGTQRVAKLGRNSDFSSNINAGAEGLEKGQIAGEAKMDTEDFVCFRDGETSFAARNDIGIEQYSCTADYWCPSIQV